MSKIIKHIELSKLDRSLLEGDVIRPKENIFGFTANRNYVVRKDEGITCLYIKNNYGKITGVYGLDLDNWLLEQTEDSEDLRLSTGDKITPLVDMLDFTEGVEYEVKNSFPRPNIIFIVSDSNKVTPIVSLAPKLWRKVTDDECIKEEDKLTTTKENIVVNKKNPFNITPYTNSTNTVKEEFSGGSVNYYRVDITKPLSDDLKPCTVEFEDIALALGLEPMEYNIMKELWRTANARTNGLRKKGHNTKYGREKVLHYAKLLHKLEEQ